MNPELYNKAVELTTDETTVPTSAKKGLLNLFWTRSYRNITHIREINELDFVETMHRFELKYKLMGNLTAMFVFSIAWNTILKRFMPISKFLLGGLFINYSGEAAVSYNIDRLYFPLLDLFKENYLSKVPPK